MLTVVMVTSAIHGCLSAYKAYTADDKLVRGVYIESARISWAMFLIFMFKGMQDARYEMESRFTEQAFTQIEQAFTRIGESEVRLDILEDRE